MNHFAITKEITDAENSVHFGESWTYLILVQLKFYLFEARMIIYLKET